MTVCVVLVLAAPVSGQTQAFKMTLSSIAGWPVSYDNGLGSAQVFLCSGKSNLFQRAGNGRGFPAPNAGNFICSTTGYWNDEPPEGWEPDPDCPDGVKVEFVDPELTHVVRFEDGSQMYWVLDKTEESYGCYNPVENSFVNYVYWDIIGGSGRYAGATGKASWVLPFIYLPVGDPTAPLAMVATAQEGLVIGTVIYGP